MGLPSPPQVRACVTAPPAAELGPQPHPTRRVGENTWKLCNPATLQLRGGQTELMVLRAKPVILFGQETGVQDGSN